MQTPPEPKKKYWFPVKTSGPGWGPPTCWQGWAVLGTFVVFLGLGALFFRPEEHAFRYVAYSFVLSAALITICLIKGEPLGRRNKD